MSGTRAIAPGTQHRYAIMPPMTAQSYHSTPTVTAPTPGYITITNSTGSPTMVTTTSGGPNPTFIVTAGTSTGQTTGVLAQHNPNSGWTQTQIGNPPGHPYHNPGNNYYTQPPPQVDPRIGNRYLNASDLLEEFIKDLGTMDVRQGEVLQIPVEMFINWLIVKAAEADGHEPPDDIKKLPVKLSDTRPDHCRCCGQFLTDARRNAGVWFCSGGHQEKYLTLEQVSGE